MVPLTSGSESLRSSCFQLRYAAVHRPVRFVSGRRAHFVERDPDIQTGVGRFHHVSPPFCQHIVTPRRGRRASRSAAQCNPVIPAVPICACQRRIHHRLRRRACPSLPGRRSDCARPRRADAKFDLRFSLLDRHETCTINCCVLCRRQSAFDANPSP